MTERRDASRYTAIHFDMDGVIADTEPLHVAAEQQTCRDYEFAIESSRWAGFKGMTARAIFSHLLQNYGDPETQTVEELMDHKTNLFLEMARTRLEPIDGALDFLRWTRDNYNTIALVTSSNALVRQCITDSLGIGRYFDCVITGDDVVSGKPDPEPYLKSLRYTGASAVESLVIEDSHAGIRSGLAAGCDVLAIATSHSTDELAGFGPTYVAADYIKARRAIT